MSDLEGLVNGFIEAMRDRAKAGYSIDVLFANCPHEGNRLNYPHL